MREKTFSFQLLCVLLRDTCVQLLKKMQSGRDWKKEKKSHWRAQRLLCVALALNFHTEFSHWISPVFLSENSSQCIGKNSLRKKSFFSCPQTALYVTLALTESQNYLCWNISQKGWNISEDYFCWNQNSAGPFLWERVKAVHSVTSKVPGEYFPWENFFCDRIFSMREYFICFEFSKCSNLTYSPPRIHIYRYLESRFLMD